MQRKVATPAGAARAEDPGLSNAKEAAEAVPSESIHLKRNDLENGMFLNSQKKRMPGRHPFFSFILLRWQLLKIQIPSLNIAQNGQE